MSLPESTRHHLDTSNLDAIEDEWLVRTDEQPADVAYFVGVSTALSEAGEAEHAKTLLRLLDDELCARALWRERLGLLLAAGALYCKPTLVYSSVIETVEKIHSGSESLPEMLRISGLNRTTTDLRTIRLQVERLAALMTLDVGSVVRMEGKGVGRIASINFDLGSYKIDFERHTGLTVGFKAGAKLLEPLPTGHILRAKLEDLERLQRWRDEKPSELLRETLESYDAPLAAAEIRSALDGVVGKSEWSRWWSAARSHPQVLVTSDKRHKYHWAKTRQDASESLLEAFQSSDLDGQLDLFSKNARQNPELAAQMAESMIEAAVDRLAAKPERSIEIWLALNRFGLADSEADFSPHSVVKAGAEVSSLLNRISSKPIREAVLDAVLETRPDWQEVFAGALLGEVDVGLVGKLASTLDEKAPDRLAMALESILAQPSRHPAPFLWLAQEAGRKPELLKAHAPRLFHRLLTAVGRREFSAYRAQLDPLLESGGTLPKLIGELTSEDALSAQAAIERSGLEEFTKQPFLNSLHLRFPELRAEASTALYALQESIEQRAEEAKHLLSKEIPQNRKAIQEAAALGDLRENFEYKSARQRHEYLSARLGKLQGELDRARPIDFSRIDGSEIRVGTTAELRDSLGQRREITVLGPWESDPENNLVSYMSELGESLIEAKIGDTVTIENADYEIVGIRRFREI